MAEAVAASSHMMRAGDLDLLSLPGSSWVARVSASPHRGVRIVQFSGPNKCLSHPECWFLGNMTHLGDFFRFQPKNTADLALVRRVDTKSGVGKVFPARKELAHSPNCFLGTSFKVDILIYEQEIEACLFWRNLAEGFQLSLEVEERWPGIDKLPHCPIVVVDAGIIPDRFVAEVTAIHRPHQVLIATSKQLKVADAVNLMSSGVEYIFEKPFSKTDVSDSVPSILDSVDRKRSRKTEFEGLKTLFDELTIKEKDVLDFVLKGVPNKKAAEALDVSVRTIEARRAKVYLKTQSTCVAELVRKVDRLANLSEVFEPKPNVPPAGSPSLCMRRGPSFREGMHQTQSDSQQLYFRSPFHETSFHRRVSV